jgi:catechol 2,3-dioxygenase-like lactoylglutathione lyase family enzyme
MPTEQQVPGWVVSVPIVVSDQEASKKWYTEKLGSSLIHDEGHWVSVGGKARGSELDLCQASQNRPTPIPLEPGVSGIVLALTGDLPTECAHLRSLGVEFAHDREKAPWGWYAPVRGPDGNELHPMPAP